MEFLNDPFWQLGLVRSLVPLLMVILFTQSGLDKVIDFRGNLEWMTAHFSNTFLRSVVKPALIVITVFELASASLCAAGVACLFAGISIMPAFWGLILCALTLLQLFAGQRIAKDYAGAATIAFYLFVAVFGMFVLR